jgi:transposase-like protein
MKKRTSKEWQRLVAEYERGFESRREFCGRYGLATSTLDYWRRRGRSDTGGGLVEVEIETGGPLAGGVVASVVISWPNGVRVELGVDAVSGAVLGAMHVAFGGGSSCLR